MSQSPRLTQLEDDIAEATEWADTARAARLRAERENSTNGSAASIRIAETIADAGQHC